MAALSTSEAVGDAAKAAVDALSLPSVTCVKRKTPSVPEGTTQGLPQVVVSVEEDEFTERLTAAHKMHTLRLTIVIVTAGGQKAADDPTVRDWRQQIDAAIFDTQRATFATVPGFVHLRARGGKFFDPGALPKDFNYSALGYEAQVVETLAT